MLTRFRYKLDNFFSYGFRRRSAGHYRYGARNLNARRNVEILVVIMLVFLTIGTAGGAIYANMLKNEAYFRPAQKLSVYISTVGIYEIQKGQAFIECMVKYSKLLAAVCVFGLIPQTAFLGLFLFMAKGAGLGFTTALLARGYGFRGIFYASALFLPQNLILIPAYFFAAAVVLTAAIDYYTKNVGTGTDKKSREAVFPNRNIRLMGLRVLPAFACLMPACFLEVFVVPRLMVLFFA